MIFYIPVIEVINWIGIYVTEDSIRLRPKIKIMSRKIRYVKIYVINFVLPKLKIMIYARLRSRYTYYAHDNIANKIRIKFDILPETEIGNGYIGITTYIIIKGVIESVPFLRYSDRHRRNHKHFCKKNY